MLHLKRKKKTRAMDHRSDTRPQLIAHSGRSGSSGYMYRKTPTYSGALGVTVCGTIKITNEQLMAEPEVTV